MEEDTPNDSINLRPASAPHRNISPAAAAAAPKRARVVPASQYGSEMHIEGVDFTGADLAGTDFHESDFVQCCFDDANLSKCDFTRAHFEGCTFNNARVRGCQFHEARAIHCSFVNADLSSTNWSYGQIIKSAMTDAHLDCARLDHTLLDGCNLRAAYVTDALFGFTDMLDCAGLDETRGINRARHLAPSRVDVSTLRQCAAGLPEEFSRGIGLTPQEAKAFRSQFSVRQRKPSCFLHHPESEDAFAAALQKDFLSRGITTWSMPPTRDCTDSATLKSTFYDLAVEGERIIVLMNGDYFLKVEMPAIIFQAIQAEKQTGHQCLYMLTVDEVIIGKDALITSREITRAGAWPIDWVQYVQAHGVYDFRRRKNPRAYRKSMDSLIRDLQTPPPRED